MLNSANKWALQFFCNAAYIFLIYASIIYITLYIMQYAVYLNARILKMKCGEYAMCENGTLWNLI